MTGSSAKGFPIYSPYHKGILRMDFTNKDNDVNPMQRFLNQGSEDESAVFIREDNGKFSLYKGCTCPQREEFFWD